MPNTGTSKKGRELPPEEMKYIKEMCELTIEASELATDKECPHELRLVLTNFIAKQKGEVVVESPSEEIPVALEVAPPPTPPAGPSTDEDPARPNFGPKQIRSPLGLEAGTKLRLQGLDDAIFRCFNLNVNDCVEMKVSKVRNKVNDQGTITLISAPFATIDGTMVIFVSFVANALFEEAGKIAHTKIFLSDLSIIPRGGKEPRARWSQNVWVEKVD